MRSPEDALRELDFILERLQQEELPLPVDLAGAAACPQLRSMVARAAALVSLRRVEDMLLGDLYGLWNNCFSPDLDIPHPEGFGKFESKSWKRWVGAKSSYSLADMLQERVGNCLSWGVASALVLKATGHAVEVTLCYGAGHIWVLAVLPSGKRRLVDLAQRAHGGSPRRMKKAGEISI